MWGVPFAFVEGVRFDEDAYQVLVTTDEGEVVRFGQMAKRSQEFAGELRRLLDAAAARTGRTLGSLLPGLAPAVVARLSREMRDGRAAQQRAVDAIDPALWPRLEGVVVGTENLRQSYDRLTALCPPGWAAFGIKAVLAEEKEGGDVEALREVPDPAPDAAADTDAPEEEERAPTVMWFFTPLARGGEPVNLVAQEITSEKGHATYLFRVLPDEQFASLSGDALAEAVAKGVRRLNRALLTLNFRREPIYLPKEQIETPRYARYVVALRKLDYLIWTREAFVTRLIHNATWEQQLETALGEA
jgi:hypothetical protein